ncbi:MAG: glycosyltransferase [Aeromicrobium sp.]
MEQQESPTITVVLTTYNRVEWLGRAMDSVLAEQRVPIRLRVFDNGSTDGTEAYVRSRMDADARIELVRREENIGALANYADAFSSVDTEFFLPLADDDWLLPDFLHDAYAMLHDHPDAAAAAFVTEAWTDDGRAEMYPERPEQARQGLLTPQDHMRDWFKYGHYGWSAVLWRSEALALVGRPYICTGLSSDVDFQAQVFSRRPVVVSDRAGAVYSRHDNQTSLGYGPGEAPHIRQLFERLDGAVRDERLFEDVEYLALRDIAVRRYQSCLHGPGAEDLTPERLLEAADVAGFVLGDWQLVPELLGHLHDGGKASETLLTWVSNAASRLDDLRRHTDGLSRERDDARREIAELSGQLRRTQQKLAVTRAKLRKTRERLRQTRARSLRARIARRFGRS